MGFAHVSQTAISVGVMRVIVGMSSSILLHKLLALNVKKLIPRKIR